MSLKQKISEINAEWADAGDDVPVELKYIRLLESRIENTCRELREVIASGKCENIWPEKALEKIITVLEEPA